jgi:hypothetical protein
MEAPELSNAVTYVVADQLDAVDRWHVMPDMTVIYERRPGEFEEARVTLRDRPLWVALTNPPR